MLLKVQQFQPSTRPHLQSPPRPRPSDDKCLKQERNHALTRPHLQSRVRAPVRCARAAAHGCARCIADAFADTRANSRGALRATRGGPAHRYRDSRHRGGAWPAASAAGARADTTISRSSIGRELENAAEMSPRRLHTVCFAWNTLRTRTSVHQPCGHACRLQLPSYACERVSRAVARPRDNLRHVNSTNEMSRITRRPSESDRARFPAASRGAVHSISAGPFIERRPGQFPWPPRHSVYTIQKIVLA